MPRIALTGASRGIGRATAQALAGPGVSFDLIGRPSATLDETSAELERAGSQVRVLPCDLRELEDVLRTGRALLEPAAPDVLINNAAIVERGPLTQLQPDSFQRQLDVNLRAPVFLSQAVMPSMKARGSGRVIFVGSISATLGTAHSAAYNASKWALLGYMKCLAEELSDSGAMTCAVLPGSVDTTMLDGSGFSPRMSAEDVATTLRFYALDAAVAHNGAVVEMFGT